MHAASAGANEVSNGWLTHENTRTNHLGDSAKHWQEQHRGHNAIAPPAEWDGSLFDGLIDHSANQSDDTVSVSDVSTPPLDGPNTAGIPHPKSEMYFGDGPQPNMALWQDSYNVRQPQHLHPHWQGMPHHPHEAQIKREYMYSQEGAHMHPAMPHHSGNGYFPSHAPLFQGAGPNTPSMPWNYMRSAYMSNLANHEDSSRAMEVCGPQADSNVQTRRRSNTIVQTRRRAKSLSKPAIQPSRRPITCPTCGERISSQRNLKAHSRERHEKVRPFVCLICITSTNGRAHAYSRKEGVKRHVKTCHPGCDPERNVGQTRSREHVNLPRPQPLMKTLSS
ncbi:hypothetical protein CBOM_03944 [Ceraceosorus bombacis]|uniref:C2H2-type domain-containing protein n=1 Tax=Ceraceosorus bombacis TaxID=401625 RepID=A0A0N7LAU1_9BASI|nr:hypothetical protein CBOM_03944 [Ceraceosorus bombacis]